MESADYVIKNQSTQIKRARSVNIVIWDGVRMELISTMR
jgi:hypothetical protein